MNAGNAQATESSPQITSAQTFETTTQSYLDAINNIQNYYKSNPSSGSGNQPNFQSLITELNNVATWCRSNTSTVDKVFQQQGTSEVSAGRSG